MFAGHQQKKLTTTNIRVYVIYIDANVNNIVVGTMSIILLYHHHDSAHCHPFWRNERKEAARHEIIETNGRWSNLVVLRDFDVYL